MEEELIWEDIPEEEQDTATADIDTVEEPISESAEGSSDLVWEDVPDENLPDGGSGNNRVDKDGMVINLLGESVEDEGIYSGNNFMTKKVMTDPAPSHIEKEDIAKARGGFIDLFSGQEFDATQIGEIGRKYRASGMKMKEIHDNLKKQGATPRDLSNLYDTKRFGMSASERVDNTFDLMQKGSITLPLGALKFIENGMNLVNNGISSMQNREFTDEDKITMFADYVKDEKEEVTKILKSMGMEDDIVNPYTFAEFAVSFAAGGAVTKGVGMGATAVAEGVMTSFAEFGSDKTATESLTSGAVAVGATLGLGLAGSGTSYIAKKFFDEDLVRSVFGEGRKLYSNIITEHKITKLEETEILSTYAKTIGMDVKSLSWDDKNRALMYGSEKVRNTMLASVGQDTKSMAVVNEHFVKVTENFSKNLKGKNIAEMQEIQSSTAKDLSEGYKSYYKVLDDHYGDIKIFAKDEYAGVIGELKKEHRKMGGKAFDMLKRVESGKGSITDFMELKKLVEGKVTKHSGTAMNPADVSMATAYKDIAKSIDKQIENIVTKEAPDMLPLKKQLDAFATMKYQADEHALFSTLKEAGRNVKETDIKVFVDSLQAVRENSSYAKMMELFGSGSKNAGKFERAIIESISSKNTKDGIANFRQIAKEIKDLKFQTREGKALHSAINRYSKSFNNMEEITSRVSKERDAAALTLNPATKWLWEQSANFYSTIKGIMNVGSKAKRLYMLHNMPKVLSGSKMPKGLSIKEQGKMAAYSNVIQDIESMAAKSSEEIESGLTSGYPSSFMFGKKRLDPDGNLYMNDMNPVQEWKETGWFKDEIDDRWKFHITDSEYKIKVSKSDFTSVAEGSEKSIKVSDLINSKELFESYPELADRNVIMYNDKNVGSRGWYMPSTGDIGINVNKDGFVTGSMIKDIKKTLTHELQHSVQGIEGFARGTSPGEAGSFKLYLNTHGEVESRALTQGKVGVNPQKLYDKEYDEVSSTAEDIISNGGKEPINRRGVPVGSSGTGEIIPKPKKKTIVDPNYKPKSLGESKVFKDKDPIDDGMGTIKYSIGNDTWAKDQPINIIETKDAITADLSFMSSGTGGGGKAYSELFDIASNAGKKFTTGALKEHNTYRFYVNVLKRHAAGKDITHIMKVGEPDVPITKSFLKSRIRTIMGEFEDGVTIGSQKEAMILSKSNINLMKWMINR